ncbi:MAG: hypothetical protein LBJ69_02135 [Holosporales bacterium]|jgi:chromosome segregation ATPase|nr:hypothetical protein [Holosporales bacterium]
MNRYVTIVVAGAMLAAGAQASRPTARAKPTPEAALPATLSDLDEFTPKSDLDELVNQLGDTTPKAALLARLSALPAELSALLRAAPRPPRSTNTDALQEYKRKSQTFKAKVHRAASRLNDIVAPEAADEERERIQRLEEGARFLQKLKSELALQQQERLNNPDTRGRPDDGGTLLTPPDTRGRPDDGGTLQILNGGTLQILLEIIGAVNGIKQENALFSRIVEEVLVPCAQFRAVKQQFKSWLRKQEQYEREVEQLRREIEQYEREVEQLTISQQGKIQVLNSRMDIQNHKDEELQRAVIRLQHTITQQRGEIQGLHSAVAQQHDEIQKLHRVIAQMQSRLDTERTTRPAPGEPAPDPQ